MVGTKKTEGLIRAKTKLQIISLCLTIILTLIILSMIFGLTKSEDWMFWNN